jgi:hypothetical protein
MILGLPIDDTPVCGMVSSTGWRDSVGEAIGIRPLDVPADQKDKKMMGHALQVAHNSLQHLPGGCLGCSRSEVSSGLAMAYGCQISLFRREREHHILVGVPDPSFGLGRHSHV